jgi:hypothetical protein
MISNRAHGEKPDQRAKRRKAEAEDPTDSLTNLEGLSRSLIEERDVFGNVSLHDSKGPVIVEQIRESSTLTCFGMVSYS